MLFWRPGSVVSVILQLPNKKTTEKRVYPHFDSVSKKAHAKIGVVLALLTLLFVTCLFLVVKTKEASFGGISCTLLTANDTSKPYDLLQLDLHSDFSTLIDINPFEFQINNLVCNESDILLLIVVHTAPQNFERRLAIRQTWARKSDYDSATFKVLFFVGQVYSVDIQNEIEKENSVYRDIVQGSFVDSYRNMTYKHVMALKWSVYFCPQAKYILKSDDDVFVNMPRLMDYFQSSLSRYGARNFMQCDVYYNAIPKRSYRSKWRVSFEEYSNKTYPTYCAGWAVIYSPDILFQLYREAQSAQYFWIDDVHITGIVAKNVNVTHSKMAGFVLWADKHLIPNSYQISNFLFSAPEISVRDMYTLWDTVSRKTQTT